MMSEIIWGFAYGFMVSSAFVGAICTFLYWLKVGETNDVSYFEYIVLLVSSSALFIVSCVGIAMILRSSLVTIIPAAAAMLFDLVICVHVLVRGTKKK